VLKNEEKLNNKIANITVFHFLSKLFDNLYFQEEKNALETFFTNTADFKLSEHTFLKYQLPLEDWFSLIAKNIPEHFIKPFSAAFAKSFF
jgi:hypothetical protein